MSDPATPAMSSTRRRGFLILGAVVLIAALGYGLYWFLDARFYESTDDAYVAGNVVQVTTRENATVVALYTDNTQAVRRGQLLVQMDPAVADVGMQAAEAGLARAVRAVRAEFSAADSDRAQLAAAQVQLAQAQSDYKRRQSAGSDGAVSAEELAHARDAVASAQASVAAARGGLRKTLADVEGAGVADNPQVLAAEAQLRDAAITKARMRLVAPVDGIVAQRTVQVGQRVAAGTPLMAVVPLDQVWVDANFKEVQLEDMRVGQPVTIRSDIYGGTITYHGYVQGLGAGSGNAFALLPPQNASGNWIKIVQRVPVRIALDRRDLKDHPLRVGLSVTVSVDVRDTSGAAVASGTGGSVMRGDIGEETGPATEALIRRILAANGASRESNP